MDIHPYHQRKTAYPEIHRTNTGRSQSSCTLEEVRAHAQKYQDKASREAQNSEMLIQCLKASITRTVYNKIYLQMDKYTIYRKSTYQSAEDGVCFLKSLLTTTIKHKIFNKANQEAISSAELLHEKCSKGDVLRLCEHTRELMYELNAAGETTNDLLQI
jgi:hypothetical protein